MQLATVDRMTNLQIILIGAALAACSRESRPRVLGPELGQSTAMGPSNPSMPPPDAAGPIEGGPGRSLRGGGGGAPPETTPQTGTGLDAGTPAPADDSGTSGMETGTGAGLSNPGGGISTAGGRGR